MVCLLLTAFISAMLRWRDVVVWFGIFLLGRVSLPLSALSVLPQPGILGSPRHIDGRLSASKIGSAASLRHVPLQKRKASHWSSPLIGSSTTYRGLAMDEIPICMLSDNVLPRQTSLHIRSAMDRVTAHP